MSAAPSNPASVTAAGAGNAGARAAGLGRHRLVGWVAVLAAALALLVVAAVDQRGGAETDAQRMQRLEESYACPECQGESVADSNAAVSATIRQFIADKVAAGATDQQIHDDLVSGYGTRVLRKPPARGFASLVWVLPVVIVAAGAAGVASMLSRQRAQAPAPSSADRDLVAEARARRAGADGTRDPAGP